MLVTRLISAVILLKAASPLLNRPDGRFGRIWSGSTTINGSHVHRGHRL